MRRFSQMRSLTEIENCCPGADTIKISLVKREVRANKLPPGVVDKPEAIRV